jgi:hypothetical protein
MSSPGDTPLESISPVSRVRIGDVQCKIKMAPRVLGIDDVVTFGRSSVALLLLATDRGVAK